jgi:carboxyl-terminal processing protease
MTKLPLSLAVSCSLLLSSLPACRAADPDPGQVAISVAKALEQLHYTRHPLDKSVSERLLQTYLDTLDFNKLFFTQADVDGFEKKYGGELDESIWLGQIDPAYTIYDLYLKRVDARVAKIKELLKDEKFDFSGHGSIELSRQKSLWPKDEAEADKLWHDRIENELLTEQLADQSSENKAAAAAPVPDADPAASAAAQKDKTEKTGNDVKPAAETPTARVAKRYDRLDKSLHEQTKEDEAKFFLNSLALSYDPHSEYMSPSEMENFSINMRLSLIGIGAVLRKEDEYSKIMELVPGGPAAVQGELKVDDRIAGVAQGNEPFVDVVDMKLDKVVEMIRGKKGSTVRLQVIPAATTDTSKRKVIAIVRDEVKLTDSEARAEIIEQKNDHGGVDRLGWITLPSFYADMDASGHGGRAGRKSTTRDVAELLGRLNKENINGLIIDLRRNGGGSLEEAVNLTGLFIKKGPVVQSKSYDKHTEVLSDKDPSILYNGPMIVLTSHVSASASEIFAGALQDYGRAVIVGDKNTFGKGTVQTLLEVGKFMSPYGFKVADAGALKLTIQKFYRPSGKSTQLKGVESDVVLPSRYAHLEVGEDALKYPLPFDEVKPADYEKWTGPVPDFNDLRTRSAARVANEPEFRFLQQDIDKMEARIASNKLSLNLDEREAEIAADKKRTEEIKKERAERKVTPPVEYSLALSDVDKPKLDRIMPEKKDKKDKDKTAQQKADAANADAASDDSGDDLDDPLDTAKTNVIDPIKTESLNILEDLIEEQRHVKLAKTRD